MIKFYLLSTIALLSSSVFAQAPPDEDFSDDTPTTNYALTFTNDNVIYFEDGASEDGHFIDLFEATSYNLNFPPGSIALVYNGGQALGGTHYGFKSQTGAEFRLASMAIDIAGSGGFATEYILRGYRNGVEQVAQTVNFSTSATYGSVVYAKNAAYYMGGTLTFNSTTGWKNIDEIRFYWNNNAGMFGAIKSIDFEPAITGPLPVSLLSYSASVQSDGNVKLQWSTSDETNNSHFLIERAVNNSEFAVVGRVEGSGTQSNRTDYSFTDPAAFTGTAHYRLVQYDLNGSHKTYKVLAVYKGLNGSLSAYPNPIPDNGFTVTLDKIVTAPVQYTLSSASGAVIVKGIITGQQQFIPLRSPLAKGTYFLTTGNGLAVKLLKQ